MSGRVVTLGETMALLRTREIGTLQHLPDVAVGIGGAESNVAIGLRRLGVDASWAGVVGDDMLGRRILRELRGEGLDVRARTADASTGLMIKERPTASSTAVTYYRAGSAGSTLAPGDVPAGWVEEADLVHVTGVTALVSASALASVDTVCARARAAGTVISFDINYRSALAPADVARPVLRRLADGADIVFGGEDEFALIAPGEAAEAALAGREVVVKRGEAGAYAVVSGVRTDAPGFSVHTVDTVGAGDAFVAGYLAARLAGADVSARLAQANACGALLCMSPGDWEGAPTARELAAFLSPGDPVSR
ncbi:MULTISPECIES: sugar kinase [unclassified Microbacterium]|uniref:sugar kinase n=1 Tax=unclassified Microbacterium TaxID=2609290 RepID=UPI00301AD5B2